MVVPEVDGAFFIMGDQAGLRGEHMVRIMEKVAETSGTKAVRPVYGGRPGGPVWWPRRLFADLGSLTGDQGGRALFGILMEKQEVVDVQLDTLPDFQDIDTEEDYLNWVGGG